MFKRLFRIPERMSPALSDELQSMCNSAQIRQLALSRHIQRDIGLDCGCNAPDTAGRILPLV